VSEGIRTFVWRGWSALHCTEDLQKKYHYQILPYDTQQCGFIAI